MNGIIIAKEGFTVDDESDNQYVNTTTPLFKLYKTDKGERTYASRDLRIGHSPDNFIIPHELGYIPMFFLFMDRASQSARKIVYNADGNFAENTVLVTAFADITNIYVQVTSPILTSQSGTFGYNYFIFYDKVGL